MKDKCLFCKNEDLKEFKCEYPLSRRQEVYVYCKECDKTVLCGWKTLDQIEHLPEDFVNRYKDKIKGSKMFGIPIEDLSKEELMVSLVYMNELYEDALEDSMKRMRL